LVTAGAFIGTDVALHLDCFRVARHPTATQWTKLREQHMPGPSASLVGVQHA
jgi:hypothetical protein